MRYFSSLLPTLLATFLLLPAATPLHAFPEDGPTSPTDDQRKEIEDCLRVADRWKEYYDALKEFEASQRARGNWIVANQARREAERARNREVAKRQECLEKIDEYYGIEAPPGTTYRYDPDSRHYAYVPGTSTKDKKEIIFCPLTFSAGSDLAASVKLHEIRHTWQVHNCWSSQPGFWRDCRFWSHLAEADAYAAEERAYDAGITRGMPEEEKELIRRRLREHLRAAFPFLRGFFAMDLIRARPGDDVMLPYMVVNDSSEPKEVLIVITDGMGWQMLHSAPSFEVSIPPHGAFEAFIRIPNVPEDTAVGLVNQITLQVIILGGDPTDPEDKHTTATDFAFVMIRPPWEVTLAPPTGDPVAPRPGPRFGRRGEMVQLEFDVRNLGPEERTLVLEIDDAEGWEMGSAKPHYTTFPVGGFSTARVPVQLFVPPDAPPESTNLIKYRAYDPDEGPMEEFKTFSLRTAEKDLGLLPAVQQASEVPLGQTFIPMVLVADFSDPGLVDSFFDISYSIMGPAGPDSEVVSEGTMRHNTAEMGQGLPDVAGSDLPGLMLQWEGVPIADPGTYLMVMGIEPDEIDKENGPAFPDVFPDNNTLEFEFVVVEPPEPTNSWIVN